MMELTKLSSKIFTSSRENLFPQFNSSVHKQFKGEGVRRKNTPSFKFYPFASSSSVGTMIPRSNVECTNIPLTISPIINSGECQYYDLNLKEDSNDEGFQDKSKEVAELCISHENLSKFE